EYYYLPLSSSDFHRHLLETRALSGRQSPSTTTQRIARPVVLNNTGKALIPNGKYPITEVLTDARAAAGWEACPPVPKRGRKPEWIPDLREYGELRQKLRRMRLPSSSCLRVRDKLTLGCLRWGPCPRRQPLECTSNRILGT